MYATLEDVKRILRIPASSVDTERDDDLRAALAAVEALADTFPWQNAPAGPNVATYFDVYEDATLGLPAPDVLVTAVKVFEYPSSYGVPLSPVQLGLGHGYDITSAGELILRPTLSVSPFEGATAQRRLRAYSRVEVYYEGTGVIPRNIAEGVAYLAAGWYKDGPRALTGLTSEKLGDYSYTLGELTSDDGQPSYVARGWWMLTPSFKQSRVTVV